MQNNHLNSFLVLIKNQFREEDRLFINEETNIKTLKEWSSLQTMIIVNEIDKAYGVILGTDDFQNATTLKQLYQIIQSKLA